MSRPTRPPMPWMSFRCTRRARAAATGLLLAMNHGHPGSPHTMRRPSTGGITTGGGGAGATVRGCASLTGLWVATSTVRSSTPSGGPFSIRSRGVRASPDARARR